MNFKSIEENLELVEAIAKANKPGKVNLATHRPTPYLEKGLFEVKLISLESAESQNYTKLLVEDTTTKKRFNVVFNHGSTDASIKAGQWNMYHLLIQCDAIEAPDYSKVITDDMMYDGLGSVPSHYDAIKAYVGQDLAVLGEENIKPDRVYINPTFDMTKIVPAYNELKANA